MHPNLEPDPSLAVHDGHCPGCGSVRIEFEKDLGTYPANVMHEGKLCQRIKKSLWRCDECWRLFSTNKYITE